MEITKVVKPFIRRGSNTFGNIAYVTLDHKTSLKCLFFEIEIDASSESWTNKLSIDVWFVMILFGQDKTIWISEDAKKYIYIEKITFKFVQMKFLAMH